jgi:hypothetical protein
MLVLGEGKGWYCGWQEIHYVKSRFNNNALTMKHHRRLHSMEGPAILERPSVLDCGLIVHSLAPLAGRDRRIWS